MSDTKKCPKCELVLPVDNFYKTATKHTKKGWRYNSECKDCTKIYSKAYREKDARRFYDKANARQIKYRYGITIEERDNIVETQNGLCAICDIDISNKPYIDHCHDTGKVRGMLCMNCNAGLGAFKDSPEIFQKALDYLLTNK